MISLAVLMHEGFDYPDGTDVNTLPTRPTPYSLIYDPENWYIQANQLFCNKIPIGFWSFIELGNRSWVNYRASMRFRLVEVDPADPTNYSVTLHFRHPTISYGDRIDFNMLGPKAGNRWQIAAEGEGGQWSQYGIGGSLAGFNLWDGSYHILTVECNVLHYRLYIDGTLVGEFDEPCATAPPPANTWTHESGSVGLANKGCLIAFDDIIVEDLAEPETHTLTILAPASGGGTTSPGPQVMTGTPDMFIDVTAIPDAGWNFSYWLLDGTNVGSANPITVSFAMDHTLEPVFSPITVPTHTLAINSIPINVDGLRNGTAFTTPYSEVLPEGDYQISMPDPWTDPTTGDTYNFVQWQDGVTNPVRIVSLTTDVTLTATYGLVAVVTYTLTIVSGVGGTTVPEAGSYVHNEGEVVTITAMPLPGYRFVRFLVDSAEYTAPSINVVMNQNWTIVPEFELIPIGKGFLRCTAYLDDEEVTAPVVIEGVGTYNTPFQLELDVGSYNLTCIYQGMTQSLPATIEEAIVTPIEFRFYTMPKPIPILEILGASSPLIATTVIVATQELPKLLMR